MKLRNPVNQKKYSVEFIVVTEDLMPLLGKRAAEQMNLMVVNYDNMKSEHKLKTVSSILIQYEDVFNGELGTLPGTVHFTVDPTVKPVVSPARRIPIALQSKVRSELNRLTELGVLIPVDEPTEWVSQIAIQEKKNGKIRLCIDPRPLNKALKRERYTLPVIDDILPSLANAKIFSKVDLTSGYWHCQLDNASSMLTTFQTLFGRYRATRLPFGLSVSSEIFQKRLCQALEGLNGVSAVADDILVYGVGDTFEEATIDHDAKLQALLECCRKVGIKLNKDKSQFGLREIQFFGHTITDQGLKADTSKVDALLKMQRPADKKGVARFQAMVNYLARFLPQLSETMAPIRSLLKEDVEWNWNATHDKAFEHIKQLLTQAPVLAFCNPKAELSIECDASHSGLGAALLQKGQPLAYISRTLTDAETRYAPFEKEMLAVVFSLEKWHHFTYGRYVTVYSDHKPLQSIFKKPLFKAPKRLQSMLMRTLGYDVEIIYRQGKQQAISYTLSRACLPLTSNESPNSEFETVNMAQYLPDTEERLEQIRKATEQDEVLSSLKSVILRGWPDDNTQIIPRVMPYTSYKDELTVQNGVIFRGERLVIPVSLRSEMKKSIHQSHLGIEGCLRLARDLIFWPGMSSEIRQFISMCEVCQKYQAKQNVRESLMSHELPDRPWEKIRTDLFSLDAAEYLVTVDYYNNFW